MNNPELRDPADARQFVAQGLLWQRVEPARAEHVKSILDWAIQIASEGDPLPPLGFVADVGHMIFGASANVESNPLAGPGALVRAYEDYVLGKLYADSSFERGGAALHSYRDTDRIKGLAFLISQMRRRAGFAGVFVSPATLKSLRDVDANELLLEGRQAIEQAGPMPLLVTLYEHLVAEVRNSASLLGPEDVFELERKTAIAAFGQRVAMRQVLQAAQLMEESLPLRKPRPASRRHEVPTRILEEDTYPIGGFASISTRGSIESLLHSQLTFMERDRPDLFDIKFLRDELLYYSRDENSFLRRRRTFIFALDADLVQARFKDADLPYQRVVLLLALLQTAVSKLSDWLHADALGFEVVLLDASGLDAERELLEVLFAEQTTVTIETLTPAKLMERCERRARRSVCHCLIVSVKPNTLEAEGAIISRLVIDKPIPALSIGNDPLIRPDADSAWLGWTATLERLLTHWI